MDGNSTVVVMTLVHSFHHFSLCSFCFHVQVLLFTSLQICSSCHKMGATLGCFFKGCPNKYHYICAMQSGEWLSTDDYRQLFPLFCSMCNLTGPLWKTCRAALRDAPPAETAVSCLLTAALLAVCCANLCKLEGAEKPESFQQGGGWLVSKCRGNVFEHEQNDENKIDKDL